MNRFRTTRTMLFAALGIVVVTAALTRCSNASPATSAPIGTPAEKVATSAPTPDATMNAAPVCPSAVVARDLGPRILAEGNAEPVGDGMFTYTVAPGDVWSVIADRFCITGEAMSVANPEKRCIDGQLRPGDKLRIQTVTRNIEQCESVRERLGY